MRILTNEIARYDRSGWFAIHMTEFKKAADVLIFNGKDKMALQLRAAHDDSYPSHWDFSAGGGVDEGEEPPATAEREIKEELGVEAKVMLAAVMHYTYASWKPGLEREIDAWVYVAKHDGPFRPDPNEIQEVRFFSTEEIQKRINEGWKFHPEFLCAWNDGTVERAARV